MHIKQWTWSDWLAIGMATTLVASIILVHRGGSVRAKSKRIHPGMTTQQVVAIMDGLPGDVAKRVGSWRDEDGLLIVSFDDDCRGKMKQYNSTWTFMAKVRQLSGLLLDPLTSR
jgi:hypothetical protein